MSKPPRCTCTVCPQCIARERHRLYMRVYRAAGKNTTDDQRRRKFARFLEKVQP